MFFQQVTNNSTFFMGMSLIGMLVMVPILIALYQEASIKKPETRLLKYIVICHMIVCGANFFSWLHTGNAQFAQLMNLCDTVAFSFSAIGLFCFMRYEIHLLEKRTFISNWVIYFIAFLCAFNVALLFIGNMQPEPWFWGIDENGCNYYTDYVAVVYVCPFIVMLFGLILTWSCREAVSYSELFTLLSYFVFPTAGAVLDLLTTGSFSYPFSSIMLLMLYANIHTETIRQEVIREKELTQSKAKLMISQIQPHFMYNSLNTIYYLIELDPAQAQEALSTFSDYLRQNVNSLRNDAPVSFSEEISHVTAYLSLEKLRFGDMLDIEFNIEADDFLIPTLTIQPLVENAVKHGITQKEGGGKLVISSKESDGEYVVTIADDGVGFTIGQVSSDRGHTHVGLENVRSRLETMVGGKLYVQSAPGEGTLCTIIIPKANQPAD